MTFYKANQLHTPTASAGGKYAMITFKVVTWKELLYENVRKRVALWQTKLLDYTLTGQQLLNSLHVCSVQSLSSQ